MFHDCDNPVLIDVSEKFKVLGQFNITKNSIELTNAIIHLTNNEIKPSLFCVNCGKLDGYTGVYDICFWCGNKFPIKKLNVDADGKIRCKKCAEEDIFGKHISLVEALETCDVQF